MHMPHSRPKPCYLYCHFLTSVLYRCPLLTSYLQLRAHLGNLRLRLYNHISQSLDAAGIPGLSPEVSAVAVGIPSRWGRIRARFLTLFSGNSSDDGSSSSGNGGGGGGAFNSKDELCNGLLDLHDDLVSEIEREVAEAWRVMEGATNARAGALVESLNGTLDELSLRVEGAVSEALEVRLDPVTVNLAVPDAMQFHDDLQELIEKGGWAVAGFRGGFRMHLVVEDLIVL